MSTEKNYGSPMKHDPDFRGPLKNRSCTDVICLLLFLIFLACWAFVSYLAFKNGEPYRLLLPTDSRGRKCGLDEDVKDKPYLYFFDLTRCIRPDVLAHGCPTPQVCVSSCPSVNINCINFEMCRNYLICQPGTTITSDEDLQNAFKTNKCAQMYFNSTSVYGRCIPSGDLTDVENVGNVEQGVKHVLSLANAKEIGQMVVEDMSKSWPWILGALGIAMLVCFLYIVLMRWFAGILVWISLAGVVALLSYCIYASYTKYASLNKSPLTQDELAMLGTVDSLLATKTTWMVFLVASAVVLAIVLLMLLFLRKRIVIAIALIEESSKAVAHISSSLVFPLAPWALQCVILVFFVVVVLFLASSSDRVFKVTGLNTTTCTCNNVTNGDICINSSLTLSSGCHDANNPSANCSNDALPNCQFYGYRTPNLVSYYHAINVLGLFWGLAFVSGLGQMVLAGTFSSWYWTFHKSDTPYFIVTGSLWRTIRYHLGTVAFGSLILAICQIIRVVLEYLDHKLKKYDNMVVRAIICCLRCFFWCLEKFIKFINRNAYIMCAVHGKNFCRSAKDAFNLLMRNIVRVFVLDKVTDFLLFLGKLMITAGMVALSFFVFDGTITVPQVDLPRLNYNLLPVIIVGIATYFIACLFFNVYSMAIDTLFLCFLEDCERNDGSPEKPYYMPKSLRKILHKHNKPHHE